MNPYFTVQFKSERNHDGFRSWLAAWENETKFDAESKIRFIKSDDVYSVWSVQCADSNLNLLQNAALAFGDII